MGEEEAKPRIGEERSWSCLPTRVTSRDKGWFGTPQEPSFLSSVTQLHWDPCKSCPFLGPHFPYW